MDPAATNDGSQLKSGADPPGTGKAAPLILLIDDSEGIRLLISEILSDAGYCVTAVSDGDAALLAAQHQTPDIVITDLNMPGPPVSEVIRALRRDHPHVRIIVLSGLMDDLMSRAIMTSGVDAAIDKSMAPEILLDTVKRLLVTPDGRV
jgi:CheY-like chemotaxis protein